MELESVSNLDAALVRNRNRRLWLKIVTAMMVVVVFCTTYALILPAITMTAQSKTLTCLITVHQHTEACYAAEDPDTPICGQADFVIHTHEQDCYDAEGALVCTLEEHATHQHDASCYHNALTCGQSQDETHTHTDACYTSVLTCAKPELTLHTHTDDCYQTIATDATATDSDTQQNSEGPTRTLMCGQTELLEHQHGEGCFTTEDATEELDADDTTSQSAESLAIAPAAQTLSVEASQADTISALSLLSDSAIMLTSSDDEFSWEIDADGILQIYGAGAMPNYTAKTGSTPPWYDQKDQIVGIKINDGITSIGDYAFYRLTNATYVEIPESVLSIGRYAFALCTSLAYVEIPDSVTTFGSYVFSNCTSLTGIKLPQTIKTLPSYMLCYCTSLAAFDVPDTVTTIGEGFFKGCSALESITLPEKLATISLYAFNFCSSLKEVTFPSKLSALGSYAFGYCISLQNIDLSNCAIKSLADFVFQGCTSVQTVKLPSALTSIGKGSFDGCTALTSVNIPSRITQLKEYVFRNCTSLKSIELPDALTSIGNSAFLKSGLLEFSVPASLTTIGSSAFEECSLSGTLEIPATITSIGNNAFYTCGYDKIEYYSSAAISSETFKGCKSLVEVNIYGSVKEISSSAFSGCNALQKISIPQTLTTLGENAFQYCTSLTEIDIPSGVTSIPAKCFYNCSALTSMPISPNVTSIGAYAYYGCTGFSAIDIPSGVTSIGNYAFFGCTGFSTIDIPSGVTTIGSYAFSSCTQALVLNLGGSNLNIGDYAFQSCSYLSEININGTISKASSNAFTLDYSIISVNVATPEFTRFASLTLLSKVADVELTTDVKTIDSSALSALASMMPYGTDPTFVGPNTFTLTGGKCVLSDLTLEEGMYFVTETGVIYQLDSASNTATIYYFPSSINNIEGVFGPEITTDTGSVYQVRKVKSQAFLNNLYLTSIEIPENVTVIEDYAFEGCLNLAEVNGAPSLTSVLAALEDQGSSVNVVAFLDTALWDAQSANVYKGTQDDIVVEKTADDSVADDYAYTLKAGLSASQTDLYNSQEGIVLTGKNVSVNVTLDKTSGVIKDHLRVYFKAESDCNIYDADADTIFGYQAYVDEDEPNTIEFKTGSSVASRAQFHKTEYPNLYYLEFVDVIAGQTTNFTPTVTYPNYSSGGTLSVWADNTGGLVAPEFVSKFEWVCADTVFNPSANSWYFSLTTGGVSGATPYVSNSNLSFGHYRSSAIPSYGADVMDHEILTFKPTLDEYLYWNSQALQAIAEGKYKWESSYTRYSNSKTDYLTRNIYVEIDGQWVKFGDISSSASLENFVDGIDVVLSDDGTNPYIVCSLFNPSQSTEPTYNLTFNVAPNMILADSTALSDALNDLSVTSGDSSSKVTVNITFEFEDVTTLRSGKTVELTASKSATYNVEGPKYSVSYYTNTTSYASDTRSTSLGSSSVFDFFLRYTNSTIFSYEGITRVSMPMLKWYYITGENIDKALNDDVGQYLEIDIDNAEISNGSKHTYTNFNNVSITTSILSEGDMSKVLLNGAESDDLCDEVQVDLKIKWAGDFIEITESRADGPSQTILVGSGQEYETVASYFDAQKIVPNAATMYTSTWEWESPDCMPLFGGAVLDLHTYANAKSVFSLSDGDMYGRYYFNEDALTTQLNVGKMDAYCIDNGNNKTITQRCSILLYAGPLAACYISTINGVDTSSLEDLTVNSGDVIMYMPYVSISSSDDSAFITNKLSAGQYLLVQVNKNSCLKDAGFDVVEYNGAAYYKLNKAGTYEGVDISNYISYNLSFYNEKIVIKQTDQGLETYIYYGLTSSNNISTPSYYAIVDVDGSSGNFDINYVLTNEIWYGTHTGHRLYNCNNVYGSLLTIDNNIVTNAPESGIDDTHDPSTDEVSKRGAAHAGSKLVFRHSVASLDSDASSVKVSGSLLTDTLPVSVSGIWNENNVSVIYVGAQGAQVNINKPDNAQEWHIETVQDEDGVDGGEGSSAGGDSSGDSAGVTQRIVWDSGFFAQVKGTLYVYVILDVPDAESSVWQQYVDAYGADELNDIWQVSGMTATVDVFLGVKTEGTLQHGVYSTGTRYKVGTSSYARSYNDTTTDSRLYYSNKGTVSSIVTYYVLVQNTGKGRLYLDCIQDVLPKGFTFYDSALDGSSYPSTGIASGTSVFTIYDTETGEVYADNTWVYFNGSEGLASTVNGSQVVKLSLKEPSSSTGAYKNYDSDMKLFYLKPGQSVAVTYYAYTNGRASTDDVATNKVFMPVYDYTNEGVVLNKDHSYTLNKPATGMTQNDGVTNLITNEEALAQGALSDVVQGVAYQDLSTMWFASSVSSERGEIKPGIRVENTNENQTAFANAETCWKVTLKNEGNTVISDYVVTDELMEPYKYTGEINYRIYGSTTLTNNHDSGVIKLLDASSLPDVGASEVEISNTTFGTIGVRLTQEDGGSYFLTLHFKDVKAGIFAGCQAELTFTSINSSSSQDNAEYINKAWLTPEQEFERADVIHGYGSYTTYATADEHDEFADASASVVHEARVNASYGYATTSEIMVSTVDIDTGATGKAATSSGSSDEVVASESQTYLRYTLSVDNSGGQTEAQNLNMFTFVDNLPEEGDANTIHEKYGRGSAYTVKFAAAENLDLKVVTKAAGSLVESVVDESAYTVQFSTYTNFDPKTTDSDSVWNASALSADDGWYTLEEIESGLAVSSKARSVLTLDDMRSIRVVLKNADGSTVVPAGATVSVSFNTVTDAPEYPTESLYAYNSFGYSYAYSSSYVMASSASIGVKTPSVHTLTKRLRDVDGNACEAKVDHAFKFLIYQGEGVDVDPAAGVDGVLDAVSGVAGLAATIVEVPVAAGESQGVISLNDAHVYTKGADGHWAVTDQLFEFLNETKYTFVELFENSEGTSSAENSDSGENDDYIFSKIGGSKTDSCTVTYYEDVEDGVICINVKSTWDLVVSKMSDVGGKTALADAYFGLYVPNEELAIDGTAYNKLSVKPDKQVDYAGQTWYLMDVKRSSSTGLIEWEQLDVSQVYLKEVKVPNGYAAAAEDADGRVVDANFTGTRTVVAEFMNYQKYSLPSTGGCGAEVVVRVGIVLCAAAFLLALRLRRMR